MPYDHLLLKREAILTDSFLQALYAGNKLSQYCRNTCIVPFFNFSIDLVPKYRYFWHSSSAQPWQQILSDRSNHTAIVWGDFQVLNLSCPLILFLSVLSTKRARHTSGHGPFSSLTMCSGPFSLSFLLPLPFFCVLFWCIVASESSVYVPPTEYVCVCLVYTHITFLGAPYLPLEHCTKLNEREKRGRDRERASEWVRERVLDGNIKTQVSCSLSAPPPHKWNLIHSVSVSQQESAFAFKEFLLLMSLYLPE